MESFLHAKNRKAEMTRAGGLCESGPEVEKCFSKSRRSSHEPVVLIGAKGMLLIHSLRYY